MQSKPEARRRMGRDGMSALCQKRTLRESTVENHDRQSHYFAN
jgi:hypothetical protein